MGFFVLFWLVGLLFGVFFNEILDTFLCIRESNEIRDLGIYLVLYYVSNTHLDLYTLHICICCYFL